MPDIALDAYFTREYLGLSPLEVNTGGYRIGTQFLGGTVAWARTQVESPFMDGSATVDRHRQMVTEPVTIEIKGSSGTDLQAKIAAVVDAISQNEFTLNVVIDSATYTYDCEASDFSVTWSGPRMIARQGLLTIQLMRQPVPLVGSF